MLLAGRRGRQVSAIGTADAVWFRSLVSRRAEVCPSCGIVSADAADRAGSRWSAGELRRYVGRHRGRRRCREWERHARQPSGRSPERGSASWDVGRRRAASPAGPHRRTRRSLIRRPVQGRSPEQWPVLLVVLSDRKTVCFFVVYLTV